jgi:hypothetical protein
VTIPPLVSRSWGSSELQGGNDVTSEAADRCWRRVRHAERHLPRMGAFTIEIFPVPQLRF